MTNVLRWAPRILGVLMAAFLGIFALDVFGSSGGIWQTAVAFAVHLVPAGIVGAAVAVAWRRSGMGGLMFIAAAAVYALLARNHPSWIAVISGPLFTVGALFLLSSRWDRRRVV